MAEYTNQPNPTMGTHYFRSPKLLANNDIILVDGEVIGDNTYSGTEGNVYQIQAKVLEGKLFDHWEITYADGTVVTSYYNPYSLTMPNDDVTVVAHYIDAIAQDTGTSTKLTMSQKAITDAINNIQPVTPTDVSIPDPIPNGKSMQKVIANVNNIINNYARAYNTLYTFPDSGSNRINRYMTITPDTFDSVSGQSGGLKRNYAEYTSLPYSSTKLIDGYIGINESIETYITALRNPNSIMYHDLLATPQSNGTIKYDKEEYAINHTGTALSDHKLLNYNSILPYGTVCSSFTDVVLQLPEYETTYSIFKSPEFINNNTIIFDSSKDIEPHDDAVALYNELNIKVQRGEMTAEEMWNVLTPWALEKDSAIDKLYVGDVHYDIVNATGGGHASMIVGLERNDAGKVTRFWRAESGYPKVEKRAVSRFEWIAYYTGTSTNTMYITRANDLKDNMDTTNKLMTMSRSTANNYQAFPQRCELNKGNKSCYRYGQGDLKENPTDKTMGYLQIKEPIKYNWIFGTSSSSPGTVSVMIKKPSSTVYVKQTGMIADDNLEYYFDLSNNSLEYGKYSIYFEGRGNSDVSEYLVYNTGTLTASTAALVTNSKDSTYHTVFKGHLVGWSNGLTPHHISVMSDIGTVCKNIEADAYYDTDNYFVKSSDGGYDYAISVSGKDYRSTINGKQWYMSAGTILKAYFDTEYGQVASLPICYD